MVIWSKRLSHEFTGSSFQKSSTSFISQVVEYFICVGVIFRNTYIRSHIISCLSMVLSITLVNRWITLSVNHNMINPNLLCVLKEKSVIDFKFNRKGTYNLYYSTGITDGSSHRCIEVLCPWTMRSRVPWTLL